MSAAPPAVVHSRVDRELEARVREAAAVLRRGGLVAYPTETFYGLGALARDAAAVERLARAKGRPDGKPLPLLAADRGAVRGGRRPRRGRARASPTGSGPGRSRSSCPRAPASRRS